MYKVKYVIVLGHMVIFHIVISPAGEIEDTRYYHAWGGKRETLCTCHRLFHYYLVIVMKLNVYIYIYKIEGGERDWTYQ